MKTKITLDRDFLLEKLTLATRFTSGRLSSLSSLQGVLLEGKGDELHFFATNLNSYFHTKAKIKKGEEFRMVIEPRKILEFLSLLPQGDVTIEAEEKKTTIIKDKTKGTFALLDISDFPTPPLLKEKEQKIDVNLFLSHLPLVLFSTSSDEGRPVLTGVNFTIQDDELILVSTDGFRLSLVRVGEQKTLPPMLVPRDFLEEVLKIAKEEKEIGMVFSKEEKVILFRAGEHSLYSRLIEGEFPPYEKVLPTDHKTRAVVEREELLRSIRLVSVFARELSNIIIFSFSSEGITITPKTDEEGQNTTFQEAQVKGEEQKVAFNFKFVLDFLNHTSGKRVVIEALRPDAPVVFKSEGNEKMLHVIMPVRIQT